MGCFVCASVFGRSPSKLRPVNKGIKSLRVEGRTIYTYKGAKICDACRMAYIYRGSTKGCVRTQDLFLYIRFICPYTRNLLLRITRRHVKLAYWLLASNADLEATRPSIQLWHYLNNLMMPCPRVLLLPIEDFRTPIYLHQQRLHTDLAGLYVPIELVREFY